MPYAKGVTLCIRFHLAYWNQGAQSSYYHSVIMWFWAKFSIIFCWNWEKVFSAIALYPYPVKLVEVMPWLFGICWMIFNAAVVEYHCQIWSLTSSIFQFLLLFTAVLNIILKRDEPTCWQAGILESNSRKFHLSQTLHVCLEQCRHTCRKLIWWIKNLCKAQGSPLLRGIWLAEACLLCMRFYPPPLLQEIYNIQLNQ